MVITGGFNVWPTEAEDAIYRHPAVREAAVFGGEHHKWGEAVVAVVVPEDGELVEPAELIAFPRDGLAAYKVAKQIAVRSEPLPRSAVGKVLRRRVREEHHDEFQKGAAAR